MWKKQIVAHENFFSLDKISCVKIEIDPSAVEAGAWHVLTPTAYVQVIVGKILTLAMDLRDEALHDGDSPT